MRTQLTSFSFSPSCQCFWTDWQKLFQVFSSISPLDTSDQCWTYQHDVPCAFNVLQTGENSNGRFKQEHVDYCSSTTKNIMSPLPQSLQSLNLVGWWRNIRDSHRSSHMALYHMVLRDDMTNQKHYISFTRVPMAAKLRRVVTCCEGPSLLKSLDHLIMRSCKIK